jgi:lipoprotein-anchoring transpeptidase ErfK/SrfK
VVAGAAVLLALFLGRPQVSVSSSGQALVQVRLSGLGTELTGVRATSAGRTVALVHDAGGLVPAAQLAQGQVVRVTATAAPPSWLGWLLGPSVSATKTVRTPAAAPSGKVAVASDPGRVRVSFDHPVSVVEYRAAGGPSKLIHLRGAATVVDFAVPSKLAAGFLQVAAAPQRWETVAPRTSTVTWFVAPPGRGPVALAQPAPGSATATTNGPITITFAKPVADILGDTRPTLSPQVAGDWYEPGPDTLVFTPNGFGFGPGTAVTVGFDRPISVVGATTSANLTTTAATTTAAYQFSVGPGSLLRVEQILAQLHYLPLNFVPAPGITAPNTFAGEVATISHPLAGNFTWRWASTPATLEAQWAPGSPNVMVKGALMAFEASQVNYDGYKLDDESVAQLTNASTWTALLKAAAANQLDPSPYSYVSVTETLPETLTLWENGTVVLTSPANTGIPQDPTATGTYPIYVRYTENYMSGTNPDGSSYHDLVPWINYFNGSDAVHGFVRASYGSPQSLGCVELPVPTAAVAFSNLGVGDLVAVAS